MTESPSLLTTRVLFDFNLQKYVGIFNHNVLRMWGENVQRISKASKTKLYRTVEDLVQSDDGRVLILYKNSFCESVESALNYSADRATESKNREIALDDVDQVEVGHMESLGRYLTFFSRNGGELQLNYVELQSEDLQPNGGGYKRINVNAEKTILGYCVLEMHAKLQLLTFCEYFYDFIEALTEKLNFNSRCRWSPLP